MHARPGNLHCPSPWAALVTIGIVFALTANGSLLAQAPKSNPLAKDIAVLVDLSGSIDPDNSKAARDLVTELITANYGENTRRNWSLGESPNLDESNEYQNLVAIVNGTREKLPLWRPEKKMVVSTFGNREHTWENTRNAPISRLESRDDIHNQLDRIYGVPNFSAQFNHGTTFYELAKGAFALRLKNEEPRIEDYYLFVISDELDDLTNVPVGTSQTILDQKNREWRAGQHGGGYTRAEDQVWEYLRDKIEESKLATFEYKLEPGGGRKRVNVVVYTSRIVENSRQLEFTEPEPGRHKVIDERDSKISWRLTPDDPAMRYRLKIIPQNAGGTPLSIPALEVTTLELLKPHPDHSELPLKLENGNYDLFVQTEEETPLVTKSGTSIKLQRLDPDIAFKSDLHDTHDAAPGRNPILIPHSFNSAADVSFLWETFVKGSPDSPFDIPPDKAFKVVIHRVEHNIDLEELAESQREITDFNIVETPILTAFIEPGAKREANLLKHFKLEDADGLLSGTFVVDVSGKWGEREPVARASFTIPLPSLTLLNVKKGRGETIERRRTLRQGNAVIRFFNTHAGWPETNYSATVHGNAFEHLDVDSEKVDLSSLEEGDYAIDVQFQYNPDRNDPEKEVLIASLPVYVTISKSVWLWYAFGFLAAATIGVFGYSFWASARSRSGT